MDANVDKYDKMPNRSGMGRGDGKRHFMGNRINSMRKNLANKEQFELDVLSRNITSILPLIQSNANIVVKAIGFMLRFHENDESMFVSVLEQIETIPTDNIVELKKEFCNAYVTVCPSKMSFIKQTVKAN